MCLRTGYDDGGFSGATMGRPALQRLLADITAGRVDIVVVYKIDRLTRSLADFAKIVEILDARSASFVSVTQQFNTTTSMRAIRAVRTARWRVPGKSGQFFPISAAPATSRRCADRSGSCVAW